MITNWKGKSYWEFEPAWQILRHILILIKWLNSKDFESIFWVSRKMTGNVQLLVRKHSIYKGKKIKLVSDFLAVVFYAKRTWSNIIYLKNKIWVEHFKFDHGFLRSKANTYEHGRTLRILFPCVPTYGPTGKLDSTIQEMIDVVLGWWVLFISI